jgi:hypothetical protein
MLVLTILTGTVVLVLLIVLGWALANIARGFEDIIGSLEKIAMGVRAIETETAPLRVEIASLDRTFEVLDGALAAIAGNLRRIAEEG